MHKEFCKRVDYVIEKYGDKTAITFMRENNTQDKLSFYQIREFINKIESLLYEAKIERGDRVAILLEHSPYPVLVGISLAYLGITSVLIDATLPYEEKEKLIEISDVRAIFSSKVQLAKIDSNIIHRVPCFTISETWKFERKSNSAKDCTQLGETLDSELDISAIIFSSGTTDQMKGIKITYASILKSREIILRLSGLKDYMTYLLVLPFNHIAGYSGAMSYFLTGCELGFIENVNSTKLQKALLEYKPYYFVMIPKVFEVMEQKIRAEIHEKGRMVESGFNILLNISGLIRKYLGLKVGRKLFKSVTKQAFGDNIYGLGTGMSPCKDSTAKFFLDLGLEWSNMYATTETNVPLVATGVYDKYPICSIGKVDRHPEIKVDIINQNEDGIGEIVTKSELIMKGYFRQPKLTAEAFEDGYFKTGDYGYIDKKGCLHITGRIKESIVLRTGKKVSPVDIDDYYMSRVPNINLASRGIINEIEKYDEVHVFVENQGYKEYEKDRIIAELKENSIKAPAMYRIDGIHFINKIPLTSVGKVKRFCLEIPDEDALEIDKKDFVREIMQSDKESTVNTLYGIIKNIIRMNEDVKLSEDAKIKEDIGLDSLNCFELCVAIEERFGVSIESKFNDNTRIGDIVSYIESGESKSVDEDNDAAKYPLERTAKDKKRFELFIKLSKRLWKVETIGLEKIDFNENYIFTPNHESHFDGMWVVGCLPDKVQNNFCSMAADYLFESRIYRPGIKIMGGIPVHRNTNTTMAMKRVYECISKEGRNLIIHPEGTRTRDGKIGDFKPGAAELSLGTGVKIIPVCLKGTREIFPPNKRIPRILKRKDLKLQICFGTPIAPDNKSVLEITQEIRRQIVEMKG